MRYMVLILFLILPLKLEALERVEFKKEFGQKGTGPGQFRNPSSIAIDDIGRLYVADTENHRIQVLTEDGRHLFSFGDRKDEKGFLEAPSGVDVFKDRVYVTDSSKNKVFIFTKDGRYIDEFGNSGNRPKEFDEPAGIKVTHGRIYVADRGNHRIQVFSEDGIYQGSIGRKGDKSGELLSPLDVDIDTKGNIYVADSGNRRIQVFAPEGKFLRNYYDVEEPVSISVTRDGFFVADRKTQGVKKFDFSAKLLLAFGKKGEGQGNFKKISGIVADGEGRIFTIDSERSPSIQIFSFGKGVAMISDEAPPLNSIQYLGEIIATVNDIFWYRDTLYGVTDNGEVILIQERTIRKILRPEGRYRLSRPQGIGVDPQGFIWVVDTGNDRLIKMNVDGQVLMSIGDTGNIRFSSPRGIAISPKGIIYVADTGNDRIQILNSEGVFMESIKRVNNMRDLEKPVDVFFDLHGNIFIVEESGNRVIKINPQGRLILSIGREGSGDGEMKEPSSVYVTGEEIFVFDAGNHRVQVFDHEGRFLRKFGARGNGKGDFIGASQISLKDETTIFITDRGGNRIQEMRLLYTPERIMNLKATGGMKEIILEWPARKESYVGEYRVYRSEDGVNYSLLTSVDRPYFTDRDVKPGVKYYYRVSAFAKNGYEGFKSGSQSAIALKPQVNPPSDVVAIPGVDNVKISWRYEKGDAVFIIYRDFDGVFREITRTKEKVFNDKDLKPDSQYNYRVSAYMDGEESLSVELKVKTLSAGPAIEVSLISLVENIFSGSYRDYEKNGMGRVRLKNNTQMAIRDVKVSFMIKDFMERPLVNTLTLNAQESSDIILKPVFGNRIRTLRENKMSELEIDILYNLDNELKKESIKKDVMVVFTGLTYTSEEARVLERTMKNFDEKVIRYRAEKVITKEIKIRFRTDENLIKSLRNRNLKYSEIVLTSVLSGGDEKKIDSILKLRTAGEEWPDIIVSNGEKVSVLTSILLEMEREIAPPKKPVKEPKFERDFYK